MSRVGLSERFERYVDKSPGHGPKGDCWIWTAGRTVKGYGQFAVMRSTQRAHRVSFLLFHGVWPKNQILHKCDVPSCVNPAHLSDGTCQDNADDKVRKSRQVRGVRHPHARLDEVSVAAIRTMISHGSSRASVGRMYGVSPTTIRSIITGRTWAWI